MRTAARSIPSTVDGQPIRNQAVADYLNNIIDSTEAFTGNVNSNGLYNTPGEFLATSFFLRKVLTVVTSSTLRPSTFPQLALTNLSRNTFAPTTIWEPVATPPRSVQSTRQVWCRFVLLLPVPLTLTVRPLTTSTGMEALSRPQARKPYWLRETRFRVTSTRPTPRYKRCH